MDYYFWRVKNDQEIDIIEEGGDKKLSGHECKYGTDNIKNPSGSPVENVKVVNNKNYFDFLK